MSAIALQEGAPLRVATLTRATCSDSAYAKWSRNVAEGWIYGEAPRLKQPFWDVYTIPVLPAPVPQFRRRGIHLWRELQLPDPQFKFGGERGSGRNGTPPIGVAAFASQSRKSDRYRHRTRSYSALGHSAAESHAQDVVPCVVLHNKAHRKPRPKDTSFGIRTVSLVVARICRLQSSDGLWCGPLGGWPVLSSHFSPGVAPQVGQRTASICFGLSSFFMREKAPALGLPPRKSRVQGDLAACGKSSPSVEKGQGPFRP